MNPSTFRIDVLQKSAKKFLSQMIYFKRILLSVIYSRQVYMYIWYMVVTCACGVTVILVQRSTGKGVNIV